MCDGGGGGSCKNKKKKCNKCAREKMLSLIGYKGSKRKPKTIIPNFALYARKGGANVLGKYVH